MSSPQLDKLRRRAGRLPENPGVYIMKNERGRVIYVGKAKSLKSRVKSYFQKKEALDTKTAALVDRISSIDYIATRNEVEALVLECTLIKEHRPRYNIQLKDDKRYPFIKLTINETFPRLYIVRNVASDGAEYFGPYTDAGAVRRTLRLIASIFPLRNCPGRKFTKRKRECLNFHIEQCLAPCTGRVEESDYRELVNQVRLFLKGRNSELARSLQDRMQRLSEDKRYEDAAVVRDQLASIGKLTERQLAVSPGGKDEDVVALAREGNRSCGVVMKVRDGRILGTESFVIPADKEIGSTQVFDSFLELYYHSTSEIPPVLVLQFEPSDKDLLERWLSDRTGRRVRLTVPRRGKKKKLVGLAYRNASLRILAEMRPDSRSVAVLDELKKELDLPVTPFRIEAYDISNLQGNDAVGSMVTFVNAKTNKSGYRRFRIRSVDQIDDFAMIAEVIGRRFRRLVEEGAARPDLVLIDGGKGQVSSAKKALSELGFDDIPVIGLAKKFEEIHREGVRDPLKLPRRSAALKLLQRIRNEAHRFAIEYHRKLRSKGIEHSELDEIEGIGEKRKRLLIAHFGSLEGLKSAEVKQIAEVEGIGEKIARKIFDQLR
jgi:excinuclease ABC subunit C